MLESGARRREALIEAAARCFSRVGYSNLTLELVAAEAGCTRDEIYEHFEDKEDLARAVLAWVNDVWEQEVPGGAECEPDPCVALIELARAHAVFCRRDVASVIMALRLEFSGRDHRMGREVEDIYARMVKRCERLIEAGRSEESIPLGPPAKTVALAFIGAVEGAVIQLAGKEPHDEFLPERAAVGVLGLGESNDELEPFPF